jgi:ribulose-phosphate 3-epimerase
MKLSASVLATPITNLSNTLPMLDKEAIDYLHIDVMDGNFVPQISFGEAITKEIQSLSEIPLDIHLMVKNPEKEVSKYFPLKPKYLTFHVETTNFGVRLAEEIKSQGIGVGISLNPGTPIETIENYIPYLDLILLMTVDPGFYGQSFVKSGFQKIEKMSKMLKGTNIVLEVDGGVGLSNIKRLKELGVGMCVAGSAIFKIGDPNENAFSLKKASI